MKVKVILLFLSFGIVFIDNVSASSCTFSETGYLTNKTYQVNTTQNSKNWTQSEVKKACEEVSDSLKGHFEQFGKGEGVCPYNTKSCCRENGFSVYWNLLPEGTPASTTTGGNSSSSSSSSSSSNNSVTSSIDYSKYSQTDMAKAITYDQAMAMTNPYPNGKTSWSAGTSSHRIGCRENKNFVKRDGTLHKDGVASYITRIDCDSEGQKCRRIIFMNGECSIP